MSYYNLTYHIVFSTYRRMCTIDERHERDLYAYILGFIENIQGKLYRVDGMPDHVHLLVSIPPHVAVSEFVRRLKYSTSKWLKGNPAFPLFTGWGEGYAAFTYSKEQIPIVRQYIINQKNHHQHATFAEEYRKFILDNGGTIDEKYFLND